MAATKAEKNNEQVEESVVPATVSRITSSYRDVTKNLKVYSSNANEIGTVASQSVQKTFNGFVTFERAIVNMLRANLDVTVEHGRDVLKSPNIAEVAKKHAAYLNAQVESVSSQIKELSDIAEEQSKAALEPLTTYVEGVASDASK